MDGWRLDPTEKARSREDVRELDRRAIEEWGIPAFALMESAGRACADAVLDLLPRDGSRAAPVQVLCGPGNNGGDGLVIARTLRNRGVATEVAFVGSLDGLTSSSADVQLNAELWRRLDEPIHELASASAVRDWSARLKSAPALVDGLFGTGLTRALGAPWSNAVEALNASPAPTLAVDLPSGLDANSGEVLGVCVAAEVTVTFIAPKLGFALGAGPKHVGRLMVAEIGVPLDF